MHWEGRVRFHHLIAIAGLVLVGALAPAHADKRVALVVGNGAYVHADKLANPVNDARGVRGVRDALTGLKFDVIYGEDLDGKALRRMIGRFASRVDGADVAVVYFAGHGATFGDAPYVVPVDAEFASLDEMSAELVAVEELIGDLRRAKGVRIAILDACRDNAAEQALKRSRGGAPSRGLAPPKNPSGLIIAYATQHGATAADSGASGNSPFTAALLHNIAMPSLDVKDMFFKVGSDVNAATGGRQQPEISVSMFAQYALVPSVVKPDAGPSGGGAAMSGAAQAWAAVQNTTSLAVVDEFLQHFGQVPVYGARAREKREELAKSQVPASQVPASQVAVVVTPATPPRQSGGQLTAAQERGLKAKDTFRECADCPEMVVVPAGRFTMGSPAGEKERSDDEGPQHRVTIGKAFAVGKFHVTRDQFVVFANETGYAAHSRCDWRNPGVTQEGSHPVVCVDWDDANAYANWLGKKTGKPYRLLSEAEWEYAARAGTTTPFWWGSSITPTQANYDGNYVYAGGGSKGVYRKGTVPAGSFDANPWGLYNVHGNAWQWTADCYHDSYNSAPADGSAWTTGDCSSGRVVRGGSWDFNPGASAPPSASGSPPSSTSVVSAWPGRLPPESLPFYFLNPLPSFLSSTGVQGRSPWSR
jgi:formylglycine-generating enzyme required for sulfatase activity